MIKEFNQQKLNEINYFLRIKVKEVMILIRSLHSNCEFEKKEYKYKDEVKIDYVSFADKKSQEIYIESIKKTFENYGYGIIAEENDLKIPCTTKGYSINFTIDALDGTIAYKRLQSSGIATMVSVILNSQVVSVFIGDVMTSEIYEYGTEKDEILRIRDYDYENAKKLKVNTELSLSKQYIQLREAPDMYSDLLQTLVSTKNKYFKGIEVTRGSIGLMFARLWKGEVGSIVLLPSEKSPWDIVPILGISKKMDFVFLKIDDNKLLEFEIPISLEVININFEVIIVHRSRLNELYDYFKKICN